MMTLICRVCEATVLTNDHIDTGLAEAQLTNLIGAVACPNCGELEDMWVDWDGTPDDDPTECNYLTFTGDHPCADPDLHAGDPEGYCTLCEQPLHAAVDTEAGWCCMQCATAIAGPTLRQRLISRYWWMRQQIGELVCSMLLSIGKRKAGYRWYARISRDLPF